jgi:hypothetical protein
VRSGSEDRTHSHLLVQGLLVLAVALIVSGCAVTQTYRASGFRAPEQGSRVLRMPADIEVSVLTAGGMLEPRADWTQAARRHVDAALDDLLSARGETLVRYEEPDDYDATRRHDQVTKLHAAVGNAILIHKVNKGDTGVPLVPLPTVKDRFDYSLGPDPGGLAEHFVADYALFLFLRDTHESAGRTIAALGAAALGSSLALGQQAGFASLVDLRTGSLVWFNHLWDPSGNLRDGADAREAVQHLLSDFPL